MRILFTQGKGGGQSRPEPANFVQPNHVPVYPLGLRAYNHAIPMNISQDELNQIVRAFLRVHKASAEAAFRLRCGDVDAAQAALEECRATAWRAMQTVVRLGAERPSELGPRVGADPFFTDTPANRKLLYALREAVDAAVERDRENKNYSDGFVGVLEGLAADLAREVEGPQSLGAQENARTTD